MAEKSLKAMLFYYGIGLIKQHKLEDQLLKAFLKFNAKAEVLRESCRFLDQFYIPARYGSPEEINYSRIIAQKAIKAAKLILNFTEQELKF